MKIKTTHVYKKIRLFAAAMLSIGMMTSPCMAAAVTVWGQFDVSFHPGSPAYQGVSGFEGYWFMTYDDLGGNYTGNVDGAFTDLYFSQINGEYDNFSSITVGGTVFDASNLSVGVSLDAGTISSIGIQGGIPNPAEDYLWLIYADYVVHGVTHEEHFNTLYSVDVSSSSKPGNTNHLDIFNQSQGYLNANSTFSVVSVPEPSIPALLLGFAAGVLVLRGRLRKA